MKNAYVVTTLLLGFANITIAGGILYDVIDLGTLGGLSSSVGCTGAINNQGQIVGKAMNASGQVFATLFDSTGNGNNIALGAFGACSINSSGQVVGDDGQSPHAAVIFSPGLGIVTLGALPGDIGSTAYIINDFGEAVGHSSNGSIAQAVLFDTTGNGNHLSLGTLGGLESYANSINNNGIIVGRARNTAGFERATLFDPSGNGLNYDLAFGIPDNIKSVAVDINNNDQIVGKINVLGLETAAMFYFECDKTPMTLGGLEEGSGSTARAINNHSDIVGSAYKDGILRAVLFDSSGQGNNIDLNTVIDPQSGWLLWYASDINDQGWIVGTGTNPDGLHHAYLLKPIPEPCTLLLLGVGGVLIRKR